MLETNSASKGAEQWFSYLKWAGDSPRGLVQAQSDRPHLSTVSGPQGVGWGPGIWTSDKFPRDADAADPGTTLWEWLTWLRAKEKRGVSPAASCASCMQDGERKRDQLYPEQSKDRFNIWKLSWMFLKVMGMQWSNKGGRALSAVGETNIARGMGLKSEGQHRCSSHWRTKAPGDTGSGSGICQRQTPGKETGFPGLTYACLPQPMRPTPWSPMACFLRPFPTPRK